MNKYIALIRGINVGGNNIVKMSDLKTCFETAGFENVRTYINSGNVVFESSESDPAELSDKVEKILAKTFDGNLRVLVCSQQQLQAVIKNAPKGFGTKPDEYYSDVIFLMPPLTISEAMTVVSLREGVDQAWEGKGVLYFARLGARRVESKLSKIVGTKPYKNMTIRTWKTTNKLLNLMEG